MAKTSITSDESKFLEKLGVYLRELRLKRNWTLEETENHGWGNWQHLQAIESGKNITVITLRRVARLYDLRFSELLKDFKST